MKSIDIKGDKNLCSSYKRMNIMDYAHNVYAKIFNKRLENITELILYEE